MFIRSPRPIAGANGPHKVRYVPPRPFTAAALLNGLFEQPARFSERPSLFALKLNAPPALLYDFLRAFYRAGHAGSTFGFPFPHDGIGSAAFLLHEGEGILPKR